MNMKPGRNDPCPCGSGKKFKQCCFGKEEKKTYTASGKRKFKATLLSATGKSQQIFGQSASIQKMPDEVGEPGALLKFRKTREDYRKGVEEQAAVLSKEELAIPSPEAMERGDLALPFEPTKKDYQKEDKE